MAPQAANPGYTGFMETTTVGILHRTQWPDSNLKINTQYAFINTWVESMNSGINLSVLNHTESFTDYNLSQLNASYAYRVRLSRSWYFRPALEVGVGMKSFGFGNLVLGDQLNLGTGTVNPNTMDPSVLSEKVTFFDASVGFLFNNQNTFFGLALKHLNKPNISFVTRGNQPLDMFFSASGGYQMPISNRWGSLLPFDSKLLLTANFMKQSRYNRLDLGGMIIFNQAVLGITAATNPVRNDANSQLLTSLNFHGGLQFNHFTFGYSYDLNTTKIGRSGGAHELSLTYKFDLEPSCFGLPDRYNYLQ